MNVIRVFSAGIFARSPLALSRILKTPRVRWRALGLLLVASLSLRPPLRPSGPAVSPDAIFNLTHHRQKNVQLLSTGVRATQQNPRYSGKNNVAMRMIATFMTKY